MSIHFHRLNIKQVKKETPDCISVIFDIPPGLTETFQFHHGQNVTLRETIEGKELRRSYSICSAPYENELKIAIKKMDHGAFSSWANRKLKSGSHIDVLPPTGSFYTELHPGNRKHYIAMAAGSGITPVISIIKATLQTEPGSRFTLVYGNRSTGSIIFKEELEALKNRYMERLSLYFILSREKTDLPSFNGRINSEKLNQLSRIIKWANFDDYFICGPEEMIFEIRDYLVRLNVDKKKIHFELFTTPGQSHEVLSEGPVVSGEESTAKSRITVRLDGRAFEFELGYHREAILDAALSQGADLPFACKGGVCGTCRARLLEGEVKMDVNYALEPEEVKAGFILTCQSHPKTEKVVVDYDAR